MKTEQFKQRFLDFFDSFERTVKTTLPQAHCVGIVRDEIEIMVNSNRVNWPILVRLEVFEQQKDVRRYGVETATHAIEKMTGVV